MNLKNPNILTFKNLKAKNYSTCYLYDKTDQRPESRRLYPVFISVNNSVEIEPRVIISSIFKIEQ